MSEDKKQYMTFMCVVQYRQEIKPNGCVGQPEIIKRYVTEIKGKQAKYVKTKKEITKEKKERKKEYTKSLFSMNIAPTESI